jgi:hypothetical protein
MLPQTSARPAENSPRVNLLISFVFHGLIVLALVFFAAREGLLGNRLKKISVEMVKETPPEKPKEPEKPKVEPPKLEAPKLAEAPKIEPARIESPKEVAIAPAPIRAFKEIVWPFGARIFGFWRGFGEGA